MGDSLLCNGLVRHFAELNNQIYVFAKPSYSKNVLHMYRDNPKIRIIALEDDGVKFFIRVNPNKDYLIIGHIPEYVMEVEKLHNISFDAGFYKMAGIPLDYKWSKFYFQRDYQREKEAFEIAGIKDGEDYIFVHDDIKRNRIMKKEYIDHTKKIIRPTELKNIAFFDFLGIIEKAKEVHVHNSSFGNIIDTMELKLENVFYHRYVTESENSGVGDQIFSKNLNWKIIR